ncbi:MAG: DUF4097 family beta strand repeat protein [Clostridia bacterium]|nr:DUF4097 family beta strand repeat protein [Clostridia bacterium]
MKKALCILALILIVVGGALMFATFPTMLAEHEQAKEEYTVVSEALKDRYKNIEIHAINAEVTVTNAADTRPVLEAKTDPAYRVVVETNGNNLVVKEIDTRKWYQKIGVFSPKPGKIEVRLDDGVYAELDVRNTNGDITVKAPEHTVSIKDIYTKTVNGDTKIEIPGDFVTCESKNGDLSIVIDRGADQTRGTTSLVKAMTTNGNINDSSIAANKSLISGNGRIMSFGTFGILYGKTVNGDICLNRVFGEKITVESVNGKITATITQPMKYITSTKNGRVKVPEKTGGNAFEASTTNGNISIELVGN